MHETDKGRELAEGKLLVDEPATGVVRLTICNPEKRNALDHPILDAITATLGELADADTHGQTADTHEQAAQPHGQAAQPHEQAAQPHEQAADTHGQAAQPHGQARCVVVTGAGGMFSAGYDIGEIPEGEFEERAEALVAHPFTEAIDALQAFPWPTVAALPGHTIGGGLELALACDMRVAREGIKLGMPPAKLGLVYSHTGLRRFIDAIGAARTRELFLLGSYIDARTALDWGLVNRVVAAEELELRTLELAGELAGNAPRSQLGNKRVIAALLAAEGELEPDVEQELIELRRASFASRDMREGMRAFAEKRAPRWRNE
jgi:enoyl-CoA hydratase/carnithine racemase